MGHRVVGSLRHDDEVFEHGETVSASDVGGKENFEQLVAIKSLVTNSEFKSLFPEAEGSVIQASGTPSDSGDKDEAKGDDAKSEPEAKSEEKKNEATSSQAKSAPAASAPKGDSKPAGKDNK